MAAKYILAKGQSYKDLDIREYRRFVTTVLRLLPRDFGIRRALKAVYRYDQKHTPYVCHFMGKAFFKRGIYPSALFRTYRRHPFEKTALMLPADVHTYLKERFGNYMVPPPKEAIKYVQHAYIWDTQRDYSDYVGVNDKSQEKDLV
jgi:lipopolysaccharide cholinephosphotransferase